MPRKVRGTLPEGVYHVVSRGNRRERIFAPKTASDSISSCSAGCRSGTGRWPSSASCRASGGQRT